MKLVCLVLFFALGLQSIIIYNLDSRLALLICAVEHEQAVNHNNHVQAEPLENCDLPRFIPKPDADVGWNPPEREQ